MEAKGMERIVFKTSETAELTRIQKKRLEQWDYRGIVKATGVPSAGRGTPRIYTLKDLIMLAIVREFSNQRIPLESLKQPLSILKSKLPNNDELYNIPLKPYYFAANSNTGIVTDNFEAIQKKIESGELLYVIDITRLQEDIVNDIKEKKLA